MINYYLLTKPKIIFGNLLTFAAGFLLASKGVLDINLFLMTLAGLACIIASACVFNNYIDRQIDRRMDRTKARALASGLIAESNAIIFACILLAAGSFILLFFANALAFLVAASGFLIYVLPYSMWKSKTIHATAIGSIAGATPPVVGYCAASNQLDIGASILFAMLVLWQMPHFFSIAILHLEDYKAANIPVLPLEKGLFRTKIHMLLYILAFLVVSALLTWYQYAGYFYLLVTGGLGVWWLIISLQGFNSSDNRLWGKNMFYLSLAIITAICCVIPFDIPK